MENKQTAVEWLFKQLWNEPKDKLTWYAILKQAKQMDKEQRLQDMSKMQIISDVDFDGDVTFMFNPKKYYAETYGKTFLDLVSDEESQVHEVVKKLKENKIHGGNK
jgi:hypothetical protein